MQNVMTNKELKMRYVVGELQGLRRVIEYLCSDNTKGFNQEAFNAIYFLKNNYVEWPSMLKWLKRNNKRGQSLVDLFKNESADGGGYHMGAMYILSRLKGHKHEIVNVKGNELL